MLHRCQRLEQGLRDALCDFVLNLEHVLQFLIVTLGPNVITVRRLDELSCNTQPASRLTNTAFQNGFDAQFAPNFADVYGSGVVHKR